MYYELIWTRCGAGIDIRNGGMKLTSNGFKFYACSEEILQGDLAEIPLLTAFAQMKLPFRLPDFPDDAYLYTVPDRGTRILMNFHPVIISGNEEGNYSRRSGNYINQVYLGSFTDFYPYETFGSAEIWDAQQRGEAYYYETPADSLPPRDIRPEPGSGITDAEIAAFIQDGRRELLKEALAFLIRQYTLPPNDRQFLVIREENEQKIELWIAALESAFSPRMAAALPFATRMDGFLTTNLYTVNLSGQYQAVKNFMDPRQIRRFFAMIVGADARDKTNFDAARALPNSPFAVLDGMSRRLSVQEDCSAAYYDGVTEFDEAHRFFCREFLQMTNLSEPSADVLRLYGAYTALCAFADGGTPAQCADGITELSRYQLRPVPYLKQLYENVRERFREMLTGDAVSTLRILRWLEVTAADFGDSGAVPELRKTVCGVMIRQGYLHPADASVQPLLETVKTFPELGQTAKSFVSVQAGQKFAAQMQQYTPEEWNVFTDLFFECADLANGFERGAAAAVLRRCAASCFREHNGQQLPALLRKFVVRKCVDVRTALLDEAEQTTDETYARFLVLALVRTCPELVSTAENLSGLYDDLAVRGRADSFSAALLMKAEQITDPAKMAAFLNALCTNPAFQDLELAPVFLSLDHKLRVSDFSAASAAAKIQAGKPYGLKCVNSAHIYALALLSGKLRGEKLAKALTNLAEQGFPSAEQETYAKKLIALTVQESTPESAFRILAAAMSRSAYYSRMLTDALFEDDARQSAARIGMLAETAARISGSVYEEALTEHCAKLRKFDKQMAAIRSMLTTPEAQDFFDRIEKNAAALAAQNKSPSLFRKLFSFGDSEER